MFRSVVAAGTLLAVAFAAAPALAQDLVYSPINPSFGGNPLNSAHLLGIANAQRTATARDADDGDDDDDGIGTGGGTGGGGTNTDVDLFIRQLQGRLLSALASQVTEAIFGENPQDSGTVQFGDTTVEFDRTADAITLRITAGDGTVTVITVPQLVTTNTFSTAGAAKLSGRALSQTGSSSSSSSLFNQSLSQPLSQSLN